MSPSRISSGCISVVSQQHQHFQNQFFLLWPHLYSLTKFTFSFITFNFLLASSPFWWSIFVKCHVVSHWRWVSSVCTDQGTDRQRPLTDRLWRKWCGWSLLLHIRYLHSHLWTEALVTKCELHAMTVKPEVWTVVRDWCHLKSDPGYSCMLGLREAEAAGLYLCWEYKKLRNSLSSQEKAENLIFKRARSS